MTIELQGHVESLDQGHKGKIEVTIYLGGDKRLTIEASKEELAGQYWPGTAVTITVRPHK